jgi:hypothetical protein
VFNFNTDSEKGIYPDLEKKKMELMMREKELEKVRK